MDIPMTARVPVAGDAIADLVSAVKTVIAAGTPTTATYDMQLGPTGQSRILTISWTRTVPDVP